MAASGANGSRSIGHRSRYGRPIFSDMGMEANLPPLPTTEFLVALEQTDSEVARAGNTSKIISDFNFAILSLLSIRIGLPLGITGETVPLHMERHRFIKFDGRHVEYDGTVTIITPEFGVSQLPFYDTVPQINDFGHLGRQRLVIIINNLPRRSGHRGGHIARLETRFVSKNIK